MRLSMFKRNNLSRLQWFDNAVFLGILLNISDLKEISLHRISVAIHRVFCTLEHRSCRISSKSDHRTTISRACVLKNIQAFCILLSVQLPPSTSQSQCMFGVHFKDTTTLTLWRHYQCPNKEIAGTLAHRSCVPVTGTLDTAYFLSDFEPRS